VFILTPGSQIDTLMGICLFDAGVDMISIKVRRLDATRDLPLPSYQLPGSSGVDLAAAVSENVIIAPGERALIPTGIALEIPEGYEGQVRSRSGLSWEKGVVCLNSPGTIDAHYRGEIKVILMNHGQKPFEVVRGMRIAQLVISSVSLVSCIEEVEELEETPRGIRGFGSTGV